MKKTEEKNYLSYKILEWVRKKFWRIASVLYAILVIVCTIITINMNGGIQEVLHILNDYPEQEYQQLEQELQSIIVECDGIYPQKLSVNSIKYDISYKEHSDFKGEYTIELTGNKARVTATIGKDLKKEDLTIERNYKTESDYRRGNYRSIFIALLLMPIFLILGIFFILYIFLFLFSIIEYFVRVYAKTKN